MELLISSAGYDISCGEKWHIWGNIYFPLGSFTVCESDVSVSVKIKIFYNA